MKFSLPLKPLDKKKPEKVLSEEMNLCVHNGVLERRIVVKRAKNGKIKLQLLGGITNVKNMGTVWLSDREAKAVASMLHKPVVRFCNNYKDKRHSTRKAVGSFEFENKRVPICRKCAYGEGFADSEPTYESYEEE